MPTGAMIGIIPINCHQPLLLMSCNLLAWTAQIGKKKRKTIQVDTISLIKPDINVRTIMLRVNHQYSDLPALPVKSTYLDRQVFIDSIKFIFLKIPLGAIL
jgi:hypothetical protein